MSTGGTPARTWRQWAREEFLWPGFILAAVLWGWVTWYGWTHRTWSGGFAFGIACYWINRQLDARADSWRAWRRERTRG